MNFDSFQMQKWMLHAIRAEKVGEKNEAICLVSMFPCWVKGLKLYKKVHLVCSSLLKQFTYIYSSHYTLSENYMVFRGLRHRSWYISDKNIQNDAESAEILQNSSTSNPNISEIVSHTIINNTIFSYNYANCCNFLLRSALNCKRCTFLDNLRTITQEWNMETRQMTPFFPSTFSAVCNIRFWNWKCLRFIFKWSILVCKILWNTSIFCQKLPISDSSSYFFRK